MFLIQDGCFQIGKKGGFWTLCTYGTNAWKPLGKACGYLYYKCQHAFNKKEYGSAARNTKPRQYPLLLQKQWAWSEELKWDKRNEQQWQV